jgi:hypothetical protein
MLGSWAQGWATSLSGPAPSDKARAGTGADQPRLFVARSKTMDERKDEGRHTKSGAPTDKAHDDFGDGTLQGAIPAGLSVEELRAIARKAEGSVDSGTG